MIEYFDSLKDAGIVHLDPSQASSEVNSIDQDVDNWWGPSDLQKVRVQFCERFARQTVHWLKQWSIFLRGDSAVDQK